MYLFSKNLSPSLLLSVIDCGPSDLRDGAGVFPNGMVATPSGTTFGEVATYTCIPEYELIGEGQRTCGADGWSGVIPECGKRACVCHYTMCMCVCVCVSRSLHCVHVYVCACVCVHV